MVPSGLRFTDATLFSYNGRQPANRWAHQPFWHHFGESNILNVYIGAITDVAAVGGYFRVMPSSVVFSYTARAVLPGRYIVESTVIGLAGDDELYSGDRGVIDVE
jgi:hypothetical protein